MSAVNLALHTILRTLSLLDKSEEKETSMKPQHFSKWFYALLPTLMLPLLSISLQAQATYTAQLRGTVKDASGAVVPKATVTVTNPLTQVSAVETTDDVGRYIFTALKPASYSIKVEAAGFKTIVRSNVELRVSQQTDRDFTLELGEITETVQVTSESTLLNTVSATLGTEVTNRYIVDMPLLDRALTQLTFLAPGVTEVPGAGADAIKGTNFVSNGQRNGTTEVRLDGALASVSE